jgi:hypothetical protein
MDVRGHAAGWSPEDLWRDLAFHRHHRGSVFVSRF